jgi:hypothetical protein
MTNVLGVFVLQLSRCCCGIAVVGEQRFCEGLRHLLADW